MNTLFERLFSLYRFKILRYLIVGGIGALIDIAIFSIATYLLYLPWLPSSIVSSLVSTIAGYYLSIRFVFISGARYKQYQEIFGVFIISFFAFLMHQFLLYLLIEIIHFNMIVSKVIVIGSIFFFNYFSRSRVIFRQRI